MRRFTLATLAVLLGASSILAITPNANAESHNGGHNGGYNSGHNGGYNGGHNGGYNGGHNVSHNGYYNRTSHEWHYRNRQHYHYHNRASDCPYVTYEGFFDQELGFCY
ncbi:MAG: hypothetical protein ACYTXE_37425 [Nostoc sp.]